MRDFSFAALQILGPCDTVEIAGNKIGRSKVIDDVPATSSTSYGIHISTTGGAAYPTNVWVHHNTVFEVPSWDGINAHGGERIRIESNTITNCSIGIDVTLADFGSSSVMNDIKILDNTITGATSDVGTYTTFSAGIWVSGSGSVATAVVKKATNILVAGNSVAETSIYKTNKQGGIAIGLADDVEIYGNQVHDNGFYGIRNLGDVTNFSYHDNHCKNNLTYGVYLGFGNIIDGTVCNNHLWDDGAGTFTQAFGIGGGSKGIREVSDRGNFIKGATGRYGDASTTPWNKEFFTAKPDAGVYNAGDQIKISGAMGAGDTTAFICGTRLDKTLLVDWTTSTTVRVTSTADIDVGDLVGIQLDDNDGTIHWSEVASITNGTDFVVGSAFISQGSMGNAIWIMRFIPDNGALTGSASITPASNSVSVTFADPQPDTAYVVMVTIQDTSGTWTGQPFRVDAKTTTGFNILTLANTGAGETMFLAWTLTRT